MSGLAELQRIYVPRAIGEATRNHLRHSGHQGLEGMALWAGKIGGDSCTIQDLIVPAQQGHRTDHGLAVTVDGDELHRINVALYRAKLRLIAQIHSHPTHAFHSAMDDRYAIATTIGAFSIVVPDFAEGEFAMEKFATYRLMPGFWFWDRAARWRKVRPAIAATLFTLEA